jgi:lysozyme family protein
MMKDNFESSLQQVLVHEGGWADHLKDPGGATMKGVTLMTFRRHFGENKSKDELRAITDEQLNQIYRAGYWDKCLCDELPGGVDYAVFDAAVNSGPGRGAKWLQGTVGAMQDGGIGSKTLTKVKEHKPVHIIDNICDRRLTFLRSLANWATFGKGWNRRVEGVRSSAIPMAEGRDISHEPIAPTIEYDSVKNGSSGLWVSKLQEAIKIHVDGIFGSGTEAALKAWQLENGLEADGIAGRNTYRSLGLIK